MSVVYLCYLIIFFSEYIKCNEFKSDLSSTLSYYEVLHTSDVHHRIRRDVNGQHTRYISFMSHGRNFHILLHHSHSIFSPDFSAVSIDSSGKENKVEIDKDSYYEGYDEEDQDSHVIAHVENNILTATLMSNNNTYIIEPMWRHVSDVDLNKMLIYKLTDVHSNLTHRHMPKMFCGLNRVHLYNKTLKSVPQRNRREISQKNRCSLELVGDYLFYVHMGMSNEVTALNYMLQVAIRVHQIYKETEWNGIGKNIGFSIKKVCVFCSFSANKPLYNTEKKWDPENLLADFSRFDWSGVCLAHLFTYRDFDNGVIGLGYVATKGLDEVGGICSKSYTDTISPRHLNCALSSSLNWGRKLLTIEADLVTAHELGHNFGSNHDTNIHPECTPSTSSGGKYIMYATSVSGEQANNNRFSPCSINAISEVLQAKKDLCFSVEVNSYCGNGVVEENEQCDAGLKGSDECCLKCKFKNPSYQCSDFNDLCCKNCTFASNKTVCRGEFVLDCISETKCDGKQKDCPKSPRLSGEQYDCGFSRGKCLNGECISVCLQQNMVSCTCESGENACQVCCKNATLNSVCKPVYEKGSTLPEKDGSPCKLIDQTGQCVSGKCEKYQKDVQDQFSDLLKSFTFSKFAMFMKANIVGTILTFSLMFWIPLACIVNYLDQKQAKEDTEMKEWMDPKSTDFLKKILSTENKKSLKSKYHVSA